MNRVVICCIARTENRYLPEWLDYHLSLGFDHIYLCDNARTGEERINDIIKDNKKYKDRVSIFDYANIDGAQVLAYTECYKSIDFDWMAFIDVDEFITFAIDKNTSSPKYRDIHEFVEDKGVGQDEILLNWMCYGDCGHTVNDGRPVMQRFNKALPYEFTPFRIWGHVPINCHVKQILRKGLPVEYVGPHVTLPVNKEASQKNELLVINADGKRVLAQPVQPTYTFQTAYVRHYITKTIQEYIAGKIARGARAGIKNTTYDISEFFLYNQPTITKISLFRQAISRYPASYYKHGIIWWLKIVFKWWIAVPVLHLKHFIKHE
jgi:hypothetical protein